MITSQPTKKQVMRFIIENGGQPHYSGKSKIMFISSYSTKIESKVKDEFGNSLPYELKTIKAPSKYHVMSTEEIKDVIDILGS